MARKLPFLFLFLFLLSSLSLGGCASYVKEQALPRKPAAVPYVSRGEVMEGLEKNYGSFRGISGRLTISASAKNFSFEQVGLYKYVKGRYMVFTVPDMYGDILFQGKIYGKEGMAVFLSYPGDGKYKTVYFNKRYTGKMLNYKRLLSVFKIFLSMDNLEMIKNSAVFYDTYKGFFFDYAPGGVISRRGGGEYYICVSRNFLIDKISAVQNGRITETARFKNYVKKGGSMVPLKIYVDDYLYNVKINITLSKGSVPSGKLSPGKRAAN